MVWKKFSVLFHLCGEALSFRLVRSWDLRVMETEIMSFIYTTEKMNNCRGLIRSKPPCGLMTVLFVATHCLMIMMI